MNEFAHDLWGAEGAEKFRDAMIAVHEFAQASDCKPGADVILHLIDQRNELDRHTKALREIAALRVEEK